ncbi:MAG: hypothetical protein R3B74_06355 [Nitrospirales bacterium]|nr:hypothetical protein [Nitrospirales bacterium]
MNPPPAFRLRLAKAVGRKLDRLARKWNQIRTIYHCFNLIRFNLLLGIIWSLALYTEQGQDILRAMVEVEPWYDHSLPKLSFLIFTASFGWTAWYFARVMFLFRFPGESEVNFPPESHPSLQRTKTHIARFLGPVLFALISGALLKAASNYESWWQAGSIQLWSMAGILVGGALLALYMAYWKNRPVFNDSLGAIAYSSLTSFWDLPPIFRRWFGIAVTANLLALVVFSFESGVIGPWLGTAGILMLWATSMVAIGGAFVYVGNTYRIPIIGLLLVMAIIFAWFNDNHRVRQLATMRPYQEQQASWKELPSSIFESMLHMAKGIMPRGFSPTNDPLETYFVSWFEDLRDQWHRPGMQPHTPIPVILVSAEGGGIRAAYWTAAVLTELEDQSRAMVKKGQLPTTFSRHVFSISGVSGGSLGSAVFAALVKDQNQFPETRRTGQHCQLPFYPSSRQTARAFLKQDFLSPTVGVLLFPDMFQRFLPLAILDDRALALERSWEEAWMTCVESDRFAQPFDDLWEDHRYDVPLLFLNSTVVETGQRIIMHPLPFAAQPGLGSLKGIDSTPFRPFQHYFNDALDGPAVLGGRVPLSTAVHMSARFTYVSPAGTIFRQDLPKDYVATESADPRVIRVVDGGYFENSGAVTTDEILLAIARLAEHHHFTIHPIVIHISNDPLRPQTRQEEQFTGSHAFLPEVLSPIWALLNVRPARGYQARDILGDRAIIGLHQHLRDEQTGGSFAHFQLCEYKHRLPLGWMLSEFSRQEIDAQLPSFNAQEPVRIINKASLANSQNIESVLQHLMGTPNPQAPYDKVFTDYSRDCEGSL